MARVNEGSHSWVGWLEFSLPFQHKYGYIRDEGSHSFTCHSREHSILPYATLMLH